MRRFYKPYRLLLGIMLLPTMCGAQTTPSEVTVSLQRTNTSQHSEFEILSDQAPDHKPLLVTIYFRWDKSNLDPTYLTNATALRQIDSLIRSNHTLPIDSMRIIAYASPEGAAAYNQKLSQQRAFALKEYLVETYSGIIRQQQIICEAKGENWEEFREMAIADTLLPMKAQLLKVIDNPKIDNTERQRQIERIDGGRLYKNYILPNYYRRLRSGASLAISYRPPFSLTIEQQPVRSVLDKLSPPPTTATLSAIRTTSTTPSDRYIRPFSLKTNLLSDIATMPNIELEVPIGKRFSIMGEWTFPWWGGLRYSKNFTLQMLSGGGEIRYWFTRNHNQQNKFSKWGDYNPLCGWFVGIYAGGGVYDFQFWGDGIQGEFFIASGVSGGYAHPIGKHLHMEYSIGIGYLQTDYRHYTPIDGHKVWEYDGRQKWFGPTKAKISLVWSPRFKIKARK